MKILSKYKDFYDYLVGYYGMDEKVVLDRREFDKFDWIPSEKAIVYMLFLCGNRIDFVYQHGKFYYGKEIEEKFATPERVISKWERRWRRKSEDKIKNYCYIPDDEANAHTEILYNDKTALKYNNDLKCPIVLVRMPSRRILNTAPPAGIKFPILDNLKLGKMIDAESVWHMLYNWLAVKDETVDNMTDIEKVVAHGFDKKTSFRNM